MRGHIVSRLAALWLIALILLPFTAPFKTFDFSTSPICQRFDTLTKDKAETDDALLPPPAITRAVRVGSLRTHSPRHQSHVIVQSLRGVLRI